MTVVGLRFHSPFVGDSLPVEWFNHCIFNSLRLCGRKSSLPDGKSPNPSLSPVAFAGRHKLLCPGNLASPGAERWGWGQPKKKKWPQLQLIAYGHGQVVCYSKTLTTKTFANPFGHDWKLLKPLPRCNKMLSFFPNSFEIDAVPSFGSAALCSKKSI